LSTMGGALIGLGDWLIAPRKQTKLH